MHFKEITIPVPWGIIAGKTWGDEKDEPVVAIHGYKDNANSFDKLIPLLPQSFYYISIDLPGHGKSSPFQTSCFINFFEFVFALKHILDHFNRKKYILLTHSFGGQTATFFTQMYPEYVTKLICLDSVYYFPIEAEYSISEFREIFRRATKALGFDEKNAPSYTLEQATERLMNSRFMPISEAAAKNLLQRSLTPVGDGKYKITTAQHLKYALRPPFSEKYHKELFKSYPIKCPHLIIFASNSRGYGKIMKGALGEIRKNPRFEMRRVEGTHDVHMEHPERLVPMLSKFLLKRCNKL